MPRRLDNLSITLICRECGPVVVPADDVAVECRSGIARSVGFTCPGCGSRRSVAAAASGLALLHRAGVGSVDTRSTAEALTSVDPDDELDLSADRQVVSLRVLLDDPEFLTRLVAGERAHPTPAPTASAFEHGVADAGRSDA